MVELVGGGPDVPVMESDFSPRKIRIAAVVLLGMTFATSVLPFTALGYVLLPMTKEFGWSRAEFNLAGSSLMVFGALTVWILGRMTDKFGARPIILLGTIAVGLATLAVGRITNIWQFCILFGLVGVFGSSGASYSKVIASLFTLNRGKAMAVFGAEGTAVRFFIPQVTILLIMQYSWRGMFTAFGIAILLMAPVLYFGLDEPGTRGQLPRLGGRKAAEAAPRQAAPRVIFEGLTMSQVLTDKVFWLMLAGSLISMVISNGLLTNTVAAIVDKGFSADLAARMMSVATVFGLVGTLTGGVLMDRFHSAKVAIPLVLCAALGYLLLMLVTPTFGGQPMLLAAVGLGMFSFCGQFPMVAYFITRFFGLRSFAEIVGCQAGIQAFCMGVAGPLVGRIYDTTGNYTLAFQIGIGAALFSALIYLILPGYRYSANIGAMPAVAR